MAEQQNNQSMSVEASVASNPPVDAATPPATPATSPAPEASAAEGDKGKAKQAWERYATAVADYSRAKAFLLVGKRAQEYTEAKVKPLTDAGEKRSMRAACVKRCQGELDDSLDSASFKVADALRAWGVATVFGEEQAFKLPRGKVEAFVPTIARDKTEEQWTIDPALSPEQQASLRSFWAELANGLDVNADQGKSRVRSILKPPAQQTAGNGSQTTQATQGGQNAGQAGQNASQGQKPAGNGQASKPPQSAVNPKSPVDLAEHFAACLKDRGDNPAVWEAFGKGHVPGKGEMAGLVKGLLTQGPKTVVRDALRELLTSARDAIAELTRQTNAANTAGNQPKAAAA
jgi:hypothetical protein